MRILPGLLAVLFAAWPAPAPAAVDPVPGVPPRAEPSAEPPAPPPAEEESEATAEMRELEAAEARMLSGAGQILRQVQRLGPSSLWRDRLSGPLGLDLSEWPAADVGVGRAALPGATLPFALDAVRARYDIPLDWNEEVAEYVAFFQGPGRQVYTRWLGRSTRWIPLFREILREHEVPEDLVYLSMIESGFSMQAHSWAHATGPWQFIAGTGRMYGLHDDFWVDERRDPIKATHAAARYLKKLHETWGDWYLAWASYNAGPGRVKRAIDQHGTVDFWALHDAEGAFRKETNAYVPKLIAAALIAKFPERFGFGDVAFQAPLAWEQVEVPDATDLDIVARCAGASVETIQELNPELRRWATPPTHGKPYPVRVPVGSTERFVAAYARVKPSERFTFRAYVVQKGDTLGHIALMFGSSVEAVARTNRITDVRRLRPGQQLVIPTPPGVRGRAVRTATASGPIAAAIPAPVAVAFEGPPLPPVPGRTDGSFHVLGEGETLGHLAMKYGCSIVQLKKWNRIHNVRKLQIGQRLRIRP